MFSQRCDTHTPSFIILPPFAEAQSYHGPPQRWERWGTADSPRSTHPSSTHCPSSHFHHPCVTRQTRANPSEAWDGGVLLWFMEGAAWAVRVCRCQLMAQVITRVSQHPGDYWMDATPRLSSNSHIFKRKHSKLPRLCDGVANTGRYVILSFPPNEIPFCKSC